MQYVQHSATSPCVVEVPFRVAWYCRSFAGDNCSTFELQPSTLHDDSPFWIYLKHLEALRNLNLLTIYMIYIFVFISTQRDYKVKNESTRNNKLETAGGGHRRGRSDSPPRNTETTSFLVVFLLCRCSCFVVVLVLVVAVLVLVVAFVVLGVPFVFAALIVCAAGVMLNVAVVALVIKQKNKEASRKAKSSEGRKAKNNAKQTNKTHRN